jgi:cysteine desulfuration protein SufE
MLYLDQEIGVLLMAPVPIPSPHEILEDLAAEFDMLGDWEDRYRHIIDLGRSLPPLTDAERCDANKVRGCSSQVWIVTQTAPDGRLILRGDSDAHIVRGLVALVLQLYSGQPPQAILALDPHEAFARLGLSTALSSQRANGLKSMVERIRQDAHAAVSRRD